MATQVDTASDLLDWYTNAFPKMESAATEARSVIQTILDDANVETHAVQARAKQIDSLREKLLRKTYTKPKTQITDFIGVRVITYYADSVDRAAELVKRELTVHKTRSVDKRTVLGLSEFGYRSYHLVAKLRDRRLRDPAFANLRDSWFEVQIRTVLEHAWAEIEHEIIYKSGCTFPKEIRRRFASLAGMLEVLDREFDNLNNEQSSLTDIELQRIQQDPHCDDQLDVSCLLAALEYYRPDGLSFRQAQATGKPFPPKIEARFVLALGQAGLHTLSQLRDAMDENQFLEAVRTYALSEGISPAEVSHLGVCALVLGLQVRKLLDVYFPALASDPSLSAALG